MPAHHDDDDHDDDDNGNYDADDDNDDHDDDDDNDDDDDDGATTVVLPEAPASCCNTGFEDVDRTPVTFSLIHSMPSNNPVPCFALHPCIDQLCVLIECKFNAIARSPDDMAPLISCLFA